MFPLLMIGALALQFWAWRRIASRLKNGPLTRSRPRRATQGGPFCRRCCCSSPIYFAMVGLEEWRHVALIDERAAFLIVPVLTLSVVGTIGFAVRCAFVRRA